MMTIYLLTSVAYGLPIEPDDLLWSGTPYTLLSTAKAAALDDAAWIAGVDVLPHLEWLEYEATEGMPRHWQVYLEEFERTYLIRELRTY